MPVVVWVHDVGFFGGDRAKTPELLADFCAHELEGPSIDYRLSHEAYFDRLVVGVGGRGWG